MSDAGPVTYKDAGVDIDRATAAKKRIAELARSTFTPGVLGEVGGFGGLFSLSHLGLKDPVLVASADGVGTKLKIAFQTGRHDSVGADLVNHCINDIFVQAARPLFFLDYFASGGLPPATVAAVIEGVARACCESGCALIGGETAEMPGFYAPGEYDLAGTIVGVVERERLLPRRDIHPGDRLLGVPSIGLHTNGYSLARKVFLDKAGLKLDSLIPGVGLSVADALLLPHPSYLKKLSPAVDAGLVKGLAHITGGGLPDNVPRIVPKGQHALVRRGSWPVLPLFTAIAELGGVPDDDMYRTFNMGVGMVLVVAEADRDRVRELIAQEGEICFEIGEIAAGDGPLRFA